MTPFANKLSGVLWLLILALFAAALRAEDAAEEMPEVMSPEYYAIWNDDVQKQIDERTWMLHSLVRCLQMTLMYLVLRVLEPY